MKKYIILFLVIIMTALSSCNQKEPDEVVRIWMYRQYGISSDDPQEQIRQMTEDEITNFAQENDIKVEFSIFKDNELSMDDYTLKRNLALEHGEADIILDGIYSNLYQTSGYAGDYTKLSNYEKIFDSFKGQYCIPLCSYIETFAVNNDLLDIYGVESEKYIDLDKFYEIKQHIKDKGAQFKLDESEFEQLSHYYISKNNLVMENNNGKYILNRDETLQTIREVANDLQKYYDLENIYEEELDYMDEDNIYDEASRRLFSTGRLSPFKPLKFMGLTLNDEQVPFDSYTVVIRDDIERQMMRWVPCLLINKNTTKDGVYQVADYLLSDRFQGRLYENIVPFSTITESPELKTRLKYDDDWNYIYEPGMTKIYNTKLGRKDVDEIIDVVSSTYDMLRLIETDKFFQPFDIWYSTLNFVRRESLKMTQNQNYAEEEFDKNIDEFLTTINVLYN